MNLPNKATRAAFTVSCNVEFAENGYILAEYDVTVDEVTRKVAKTPAEFEQLFSDWAFNKAQALRQLMEKRQKTAK